MYYQPVRLKVFKLLQKQGHILKLSVCDDGVHRHIELLAVCLAVCLDLAYVLEGEVDCPLTGREALQAEIDGIGSAFERIEGTLERPCG